MTKTKRRHRTVQHDGPDPVDMHVGQRIRLARLAQGISQEQLAEAIGLTFQQVQKYERGANRVACSRLHAIAGFFGKPHSWFFEGLEAASPELKACGRPPRIDRAVAADIAASEERSRQKLEMMRAFQDIEDPGVRKHVFCLVKALARNPVDAGIVSHRLPPPRQLAAH